MPLILNKSDLKGTCYMELLPGPFCGRYWNEGSAFIPDEDFFYLAPFIESHFGAYDHFGINNEIDRDIWQRILADIDTALSDTPEKFSEDERDLACHISVWVRARLITHDRITILGM